MGELERISQYWLPGLVLDGYKNEFVGYLERLLGNGFDFEKILGEPAED